MTNQQIAEIFYNIAKMLEIKGGNKFRVIAFENAAESIERQAEDIQDIYKKGGVKALDAIEGIGSGIAKRIEELLKTGHIKDYEILQKQVPLQEVALTKIPGVGPKTAQVFYKKLHIKNISELEKAAKQGKISNLPRFSQVSEKNILRSIEQYRHYSKEQDRMLLAVAWPIAQEALDYLKKNKNIIKCDAVGSLRRMKETIGDIDIIAACQKSKEVIEYLARAPFVSRVLAKGNTKCSVSHSKGARIDLEILPAKNYASLLQHFTGSKEHNVALRTFAKAKGLSISEYGIKNVKNKKNFIPKTEEDLYNHLKMQYIEPEMRENTGEIEAALKNQLPKLIELKNIKGDLHVHSIKSDGTLTYKELIEMGIDLGYEYLCISDHTQGLGVAQGMSERELIKSVKEIKVLNKKYKKIKLLAGCEVNITASGKLDISDKILSQLDLVVASVHSAFNQPEKVMTQRILEAIKNPNVDVIGHPSGRIIGRRDPYNADWKVIFTACAKYKTALEISAHWDRLDLRDYLIQEARKYGCKFAINTDAHNPGHFKNLIFGVGTARRGWAEKKEVINCLSYDDLMKWLKK